jgi:SAM-dependent methyltransferase
VTSGYAEVAAELRSAYARSASQRDQMEKHAWKLDERNAFLVRSGAEGKHRLLEVGAGTGQDSAFFADNGLDVVATDLTPEMVELCRAKGLDAHVMDFLDLRFPDESFDAVWSMNCLLHVPSADLPAVLSEIKRCLRPDGLFFLGVYGGTPSEGILETDKHDPKRFFSLRSDEQLQAFAREHFEVVDFHVVDLGISSGPIFVFQSLTLRRS